MNGGILTSRTMQAKPSAPVKKRKTSQRKSAFQIVINTKLFRNEDAQYRLAQRTRRYSSRGRKRHVIGYMRADPGSGKTKASKDRHAG